MPDKSKENHAPAIAHPTKQGSFKLIEWIKTKLTLLAAKKEENPPSVATARPMGPQ